MVIVDNWKIYKSLIKREIVTLRLLLRVTTNNILTSFSFNLLSKLFIETYITYRKAQLIQADEL